jgi:ATP-dependent DNA helicase DinG
LPRIYVALDLETTGLSADKDAIIEVGAVKYRDGEPVETFASLVNPGRPVPYEITLLTGIRNEDVIGKPKFDQVGSALQRFVGSVPVVGHNVAFDLGFLRPRGLFLDNVGLDTWELASVLIPSRPSYSLSSLAAHFGIPSPDQHRALNDAEVTGKLFEILCEHASMLPKGVLTEIARLAEALRQTGTDWSLRSLFSELVPASHKSGSSLLSAPLLEHVVPNCSLFERWECAEPLQPRDDPLPVDLEDLSAMLQPNGVFADLFPGYEHRPQQVEMLCAVADAFNSQHHLMAEAGTGTGKSLAYLLPAIAHAARNGERVVISTNTINLQDQLFQKDLPDLERAFQRTWGRREPFRAVLLKGRTNYLCTKRFAALRARGPATIDEARGLARILCWLGQTETGDQAELSLPWQGDRAVWASVSAASEGCSLERCGRELGGRCYFYRARKSADAAHVIVVNHALLMADAATQNRVLPEYHRLIVDEAHHLENAVTDQLSFRADGFTLNGLFDVLFKRGSGVGAGTDARDGSSSKPRNGLLGDVSALLRPAVPEHIFAPLQNALIQTQGDVEAARGRLDHFWRVIEEFVREMLPRAERDEYETRLRITSAVRAQPLWVDVEVAWDDLGVLWVRLVEHLDALLAALNDVHEASQSPGFTDRPNFSEELERLLGELTGSLNKLSETDEILEKWVMRPDDKQVYWVEVQNGVQTASKRPVLRMAPVYVGELVQENILFRNGTVVLTSATLRTGGSFDYMRERLGADSADVAFVGSPFDYKACTLLYLPTDLPEPNAPSFQAAVEQALISLAKALDGRTLALFTSYAQLRRTASTVGPALTQARITALSQAAGGSRHQLLETFKTSERTVLLGTRSFWEGVDVVGPALSALMIVRLPFAVPSDPIVAARSETVDDPFYQYQVPDAILKFRQGFGRLIRSKTDRGVVVVMDKRVTSKSYGKLFLESLPECTVMQAPLMNLAQAAKNWVDAK